MRLVGRCAAGAAFVACIAVAMGCVQQAATRATAPTPSLQEPARASSATREVFARAMAAYQRGAFDEARPLFETLLASYPALEDYHLAHLAAIEDRRGRALAAVAFDDRLLAIHPASIWVPEALARRARSALALGDPDTEARAEQARAAAGNDPAARGGALAVLAAIRAPTAPRDAYVLYHEVRSGGGPAARGAREASNALEAAHPELLHDPTLLLAEGRVLATEDRIDVAITRLQAAVTRSSSTQRGDALRALARVYRQAGRLEDALATYRTAVEAEPPGGMAAFDLASLLWNRDRDDEARTLFQQIVDQTAPHPKYDTARYALGRIAEQDGRLDEAAVHYRRLVADGSEGDLVREARWRLAWMPYRQGDLATATDAFMALGEASANDRPASLYWRGRISQAMHRAEEGRALYADVLVDAPESYYADLAEHALSTTAPAPAAPTPLRRDAALGLAVHQYHWSRSRELHAIGMNEAAARELAALARDLPDGGNREPALLEAYGEVEAPERALRLALKLGPTGGLPESTLAAYLYPRPFWSDVTEAATANRLDPYVVLALMRQESHFDRGAVSPAAAYGLMQLLESTATRVAERDVARTDLFDPTTNIRLGSRYLRQLLDRYAGDLAKALAAYNGGEEAVAKWDRRAPGIPTDEFVETISFRETRHYVKQVLANYRRYRRLYGALGEQRAIEQSAATDYDAGASSSAATSLPASPPNPPFDINTTTSPGTA
jgi:soluble lytic murein transglycosylase